MTDGALYTEAAGLCWGSSEVLLLAAPPELSALWAGPAQSRDDGQAAAIMCWQHGDKSFYLPGAPGSLSFHM